MHIRKVFLRNLSEDVVGGCSDLHQGQFVITNEVGNRVLLSIPTLKMSIASGVYIRDQIPMGAGRRDVVFTRDDYFRCSPDGRKAV